MYIPIIPPQDEELLLVYLASEHERISEAYNNFKAGLWEISYQMPNRVLPGLIKYFDGVNADPLGTGLEGLYRYGLDNAWHYIG